MSSVDLASSVSRPPWRAWLALARVSNTPTVVSNVIAGAVLASAPASFGDLALPAVALAAFYTAGMMLNDVLDERVDRTQRPERPLPSGEVSARAALGAVVALFAGGAVLLLATSLRSFLAGLGLIALIVLYDAWHKGNALSPVLMAGCRALVYVVAGLAVADALGDESLVAAALLFAYVVGLTQLAKAEGGGLAARWPVIAVLAPAVYWLKELPALDVALLLAAFAAWAAWALRLALGPRRVGAAVSRLIAGIALYDGVVVAAAGGSGAAVAACVVAFAATVGLQTVIAGT
jgi:4-hydroxybenzoate polyprenyltransferase